MEVIRNYPNQVFHEEGDYAVFRRALTLLKVVADAISSTSILHTNEL
jgi:hypothetical protein